MAECTACTRPAPDATICPSCTDQVAGHLRRIPGLVADLQITLTRQARMGSGTGARSADTPVPYDHRASVDLETISVDLHRWAYAVAAHRGVAVDATTEPTALARWLRRWVGAAAQHPDAAELLDELRAMVRAAEHTIDRPPELRYVGPCDQCGQDLYVLPHAKDAQCRTDGCRATYPIDERRAWLREQAEDQLRTAAQIAHEMPWLAGLDLPAEKIRKRINLWAHRARITEYLPHPKDPRQSPRYRVGEVMARFREDAPSATGEATGAA